MIRRPLRGGGTLAVVLGLCLLPAPSAGARAPDRFAGVNYAFYPSVSSADARQMARGRVGTARFGLEWFRIQHSEGPYDWSHSDETIGNLASHGIDAVPVLFGTPYWATNG